MSTSQYRIEKSYRFEATHLLRDHDGKCARIHGHSYKVDVSIAAERLSEGNPRTPNMGPGSHNDLPDDSDAWMVRDFAELDEVMKPVIESVDHYWIIPEVEQRWYELSIFEQPNELEDSLRYLDVPRTTAECLAEWFARQVSNHDRLVSSGYLIREIEVTVWETEKSRATFNLKP